MADPRAPKPIDRRLARQLLDNPQNTIRQVAAQLGVSVKTADTYKARAMEKLGLHSRAALVRYALQRGWLNEN